MNRTKKIDAGPASSEAKEDDRQGSSAPATKGPGPGKRKRKEVKKHWRIAPS